MEHIQKYLRYGEFLFCLQATLFGLLVVVDKWILIELPICYEGYILGTLLGFGGIYGIIRYILGKEPITKWNMVYMCMSYGYMVLHGLLAYQAHNGFRYVMIYSISMLLTIYWLKGDIK